jgi:CheY-like chemotaxis protein
MEGPRVDILLVEDDPNDVAVAMRAFKQNAIAERVGVFRDGVELLDYLKSHDLRGRPPKVILLDLKMPRMDGRAALRELRNRPETRHVPVVVVSSSDQPSDIHECYELGANSFVVKRITPYTPGSYLVETVRYWLEINAIAN